MPYVHPSGRCLSALDNTDEYAWENCQLWGLDPDARENTPFITINDARQLAAFIWEHTRVVGMPAEPPTIEYGNVCEEYCESFYEKPVHRIWLGQHPRDGVDRQALLHELAHALLPAETTTHAESDMYRCVLEHLYDAYGGWPPTGVCGDSNAPYTTAE